MNNGKTSKYHSKFARFMKRWVKGEPPGAVNLRLNAEGEKVQNRATATE